MYVKGTPNCLLHLFSVDLQIDSPLLFEFESCFHFRLVIGISPSARRKQTDQSMNLIMKHYRNQLNSSL
uniref:Uncharacterized protein n=1 Tax=Anguilla anguilla TaxID=7936 RepID=A0A0E9PKD0_ANGAN